MTVATQTDPKITARIVLDVWVPALRSGKYTQGTGSLRDANDNFCCLGVLCDRVNPEGWTFNERSDRYEFEGNPTTLPQKFAETLGLDDWGTFGQLSSLINERTNSELGCLTNLNDSGEADFDFIADLLTEAANNVLNGE